MKRKHVFRAVGLLAMLVANAAWIKSGPPVLSPPSLLVSQLGSCAMGLGLGWLEDRLGLSR